MLMHATKAIDISEIKLFIFDLDGTIIPLHKRFYAVWSDTLTKFNLPRISWNNFMQRIEEDSLEETIDQSLHEVFHKTFLSVYSQYWSPDDTIIPGAKEVLIQLKNRGFKLALATGRISNTAELINEMRHYELDHLFEVLTFQKVEDFGSGTPKEKQIKHILEELNISPYQAVMVGDYKTDIRSGKAMGLKTIALLSSRVSVEIIKKEKPDLILNSINDLPDVICD